jgi:Zn-dependent M28 family amino/carboxypeptidase
MEQPLVAAGGANVIATVPGDIDRYVLVAAHFDHLGTVGSSVYRGADDNAAAVAILIDVARSLVNDRAAGRGVIIAAFDAEEPPHFLSGSMGSEHFARHPTVPLDRIDLMVCMDLVGHALGDASVPASVRQTLFALGSERSDGTSARVDAIAEPGVVVRRLDAEIIPPLSDYGPFWSRSRPFLFLTSARSRVYHTPQDTPDRLDYGKMEGTARWLSRFVRDACARDSAFAFHARRDDRATLDSLIALLTQLPDQRAAQVLATAQRLHAQCGADGALPGRQRYAVSALVAMVEGALA